MALSRRSRRCAVGALLACLLLASCAQAQPGATPSAGAEQTAELVPESGGAIAIGVAAETTGWNPATAQWANLGTFYVANSIFDPLAVVDTNGNTRPYLAKSITPSADFTTWTIELRAGVTFHNAEPLDAAAVKKNLDATVASPLTGLLLEPIESVEVVDPLTVAVHLNTPWSMFALQLARQPGYMAAPAMIDDPEGAMHPIGTGPFTFDEWVPNSVLKVTRNPDYWQEGLPRLDSIEFRILPDSLSRETALASGDIDIAQLVEGEQFVSAEEAAAAGDLQVFTDEDSETDELAMVLNTAKEPFSDPVARRAVAHAIDRDALAEQTSAGAFPAATGPFEPSSPYYLDPAEAGWPAHDVAEASELADQYEREHGKPLAFSYTTSTDSLARAQVIQAQMKEAGIDMTVNGLEFSAIILAVLTGDYEAATFAMLDAPNLDQSHQFLATEPQETGISLNVSRLLDEDVQREMDAARSTDDQSAWIEGYQAVQRRMAENLDWIMFMRNISGVSYANDVHGLTESTDRAGTFLAPMTALLWIDSSS